MSVRIPDQPILPSASNVDSLRNSLTQTLGEMSREINRTPPEDQALAFSYFMGA